MAPTEFEPAIPASKRPQTYTLDRAATGIGIFIRMNRKMLLIREQNKRWILKLIVYYHFNDFCSLHFFIYYCVN